MRKCLLFIILYLSSAAEAVYVLGYDFRFTEGQVLAPGKFKEGEKYSAIVVLADHHGRSFGVRDGLQAALYANEYEGMPLWLTAYLKDVVAEWYYAQLRRYPKIYEDKVEEVIAGLRTEEPIREEDSMVIFTEFGDPFSPLTTIRVAASGEDGLVANERHYLSKGLSKMFERKIETRVTRSVPHFRLQPPFDVLNVQFPDELLPVTADEEDIIEMKTWGVGEDVMLKQFWLYSYLVARKHRLVFQGRNGKRVSRVALDAFGKVLHRNYQLFNFKEHDMVQNEHTYGLPLYFMDTDVGDMDAAVMEIARKRLSRDRKWLVPNSEIVQKIISCGGAVGFPRKILKAKN